VASGDSQTIFDEYYFAHGCGRPYQRDSTWLRTFAAIADRIISDINPKTVLDAGCAMGFLVEGLRQREVEAYGIDISEYAIENVHPEIKPYCWVGSIAEPFQQTYDLIVSIEVLEHMSQADAEQAIRNFCTFSDRVLFSSTPFDYREATHFNVQPPEYWAEQFARHGFLRDVDFDASFITPWAVLYTRKDEPVHRIVRDYERRFWLSGKENVDLRSLNLEMRDQLADSEQKIQRLEKDSQQLDEILNSQTWKSVLKLRELRRRYIPEGGRRERLMFAIMSGLRLIRREGLIAFLLRLGEKTLRQMRIFLLRLRFSRRIAAQSIHFDPVVEPEPVKPHTFKVDVVVCVHNALEDARRCFESVLRSSTPPYSLIIVDDGSGEETKHYLDGLARSQGLSLLRNEQAVGYTLAANQGLRQSSGDFVILLNSDTIVPAGWLDRMVGCAQSDPKIGLVGPLSNTASWQSVPEIFDKAGDWAENRLPEGIAVAEKADEIAGSSKRLYPRLPFLNGFCIMIRRAVIDQIGIFDEQNFGEGYGEENDYCLRAKKAGWELAVADDVYIYHAQSRSYSHERRMERREPSDRALAAKHGQQIISDYAYVCRFDRVMQGIRARSQVLTERQQMIQEGRHWEGRRILFILPLMEPGGGGHVILQEAAALLKMGVDVRLLNLQGNKPSFERSYPGLQIPVLYVGEPHQAAELLGHYDAVVGTIFHSLKWMDSLADTSNSPVKGYYIQDFEPDFFKPGSPDFEAALQSYTRFPGLVRMTKTAWNRAIVSDRVGVDSFVLGPSIDIDLFRPRRRVDPDWPSRPLRIAAMVRPSTPRRQPELTLRVLRELERRHGGTIEIIMFGCQPDDPDFHRLPIDFPWRQAGLLTRSRLAALLNEVDIFADFSAFQAMGLTALEAMACGVGVIVPEEGGSSAFACREENALVVDTSSPEACLETLERLVNDEKLRNRLQQQAIFDACKFYPEKAALSLLQALFP
jgi:GT2 family glycosyltransferase/SAM-dependent methyltransferase